MRLKSRWEDEYRAWWRSRLDSCRYAYIWADGVYLGAGGDREKTALLCVVGASEDGTKELLGMNSAIERARRVGLVFCVG